MRRHFPLRPPWRITKPHQRNETNVRTIAQSGLHFQTTLMSDVSCSGLEPTGTTYLLRGSDVEITLLNGLRRNGIVRW